MESVHDMRVVNNDAKSHSAKNPKKVFAGSVEGEEADVTGGMHPVVPEFSPFFRLGGWISGSGGKIKPEKVSQSPGHQVAATLL